ncbi:MAG: hypothetical protein WKI04_08095 [Ferruginibacter sp.]
MNAVTVEHIIKKYGSKKEPVTVLDDISLDVEKGELFGVIGPDGAENYFVQDIDHFAVS